MNHGRLRNQASFLIEIIVIGDEILKTVFYANGYAVVSDQAAMALTDFVVLQFLLARGMEPDHFCINMAEMTIEKSKPPNFTKKKKHVQLIHLDDDRVMAFGDMEGMELLRRKKIKIEKIISSPEVLRNLKNRKCSLLLEDNLKTEAVEHPNFERST